MSDSAAVERGAYDAITRGFGTGAVDQAIRDGVSCAFNHHFGTGLVEQAIREGVVAASRSEIPGLDEERVRADERDKIINHPEISDFARGVVLEAQHQNARWEDAEKADFDWHAVATYLAAKALLNPPQNDGTTGRAARLHRIIALAALCANWHAAVAARSEEAAS